MQDRFDLIDEIENNNNNQPRIRLIRVDFVPLNSPYYPNFDPQNPNLTDEDTDTDEQIEFWHRINAQNQENHSFLHNLNKLFPDSIFPNKYSKVVALFFLIALLHIVIKGCFPDPNEEIYFCWKGHFIVVSLYFVTFTIVSYIVHHVGQFLFNLAITMSQYW